VTGWGLDHPGVQMVAGARDFLLQNSILDLGPTKHPVEWVLFVGAQQLGHEVDRLHPSGVNRRNGWR
jgi:hypothetical protein